MTQAAAMMERLARWVHRNRGLLLPCAAAACVLVLLVPLPPGLLDVLLSANLALSALVLLTAVLVATPLEFSALPSVLLGATLLRLVLNVASTRLILTAGASGRSLEQAQYAAGHVIWAFGDFVTAGSLIVGVIVFAIIVVIQFVVVTRGASRVSEVHARFVLDAMPGKQSAVEAELAARHITPEQAQARRRQISDEAEFYGAMDGASRFVRGDAIAGVLILLICIVGGLVVGVVQYGWSLAQAAELYTKLTIGDGLVTQIPAFIVSMATAVVVTRGSSRTNLGEQVVSQLASRPAVPAITAAFLAALSLTSLPAMPLLTIAAGCVGLAWLLSGRRSGQAAAHEPRADRPASPAPVAQQHPDVPAVDPLRLELGFALVSLVDPPGRSDLMDRIAAARRSLAQELGVAAPPVRICDDMRLDAHSFAVSVRGVRLSSGDVDKRQPVDHAQAAAQVAEHLCRTMRSHAADLLSREQTGRLLETLRSRSPRLMAELTDRFRVGQVHRVLRSLLAEGVSVRDLERIAEAMADFSGDADDATALYEHVRSSLGPLLRQQYADAQGRLYCVALEEQLEESLRLSVREVSGGGQALALEPHTANRIVRSIERALGQLSHQGKKPVIVCSSTLRPAVKQLIHPAMPEAAVLGYSEVDSLDVQAVESVGIDRTTTE
jgi:flagellar biosynthesis protein FlhA